MTRVQRPSIKNKPISESTDFPSFYGIDDMVTFIPMFRHQEKYGIVLNYGIGRIVAVRFTKAKVFYDIIGDYHGILFDNVDSNNLEYPTEYLNIPDQQPFPECERV